MAVIVHVFTFLDKASIYAFLDLAFDLVDLVLWGGVWRPSHHRPFKLGLEFGVRKDNAKKNPSRPARKTRQFFLSRRVPLPCFPSFSFLLHAPTSPSSCPPSPLLVSLGDRPGGKRGQSLAKKTTIFEVAWQHVSQKNDLGIGACLRA